MSGLRTCQATGHVGPQDMSGLRSCQVMSSLRVRVGHNRRSSLPAADLTAEMETMAQRCTLMDNSFHLPNFGGERNSRFPGNFILHAPYNSSTCPMKSIEGSLEAKLEWESTEHRIHPGYIGVGAEFP